MGTAEQARIKAGELNDCLSGASGVAELMCWTICWAYPLTNTDPEVQPPTALQPNDHSITGRPSCSSVIDPPAVETADLANRFSDLDGQFEDSDFASGSWLFDKDIAQPQ
jgi:hypothetical protein